MLLNERGGEREIIFPSFSSLLSKSKEANVNQSIVAQLFRLAFFSSRRKDLLFLFLLPPRWPAKVRFLYKHSETREMDRFELNASSNPLFLLFPLFFDGHRVLMVENIDVEILPPLKQKNRLAAPNTLRPHALRSRRRRR